MVRLLVVVILNVVTLTFVNASVKEIETVVRRAAYLEKLRRRGLLLVFLLGHRGLVAFFEEGEVVLVLRGLSVESWPVVVLGVHRWRHDGALLDLALAWVRNASQNLTALAHHLPPTLLLGRLDLRLLAKKLVAVVTRCVLNNDGASPSVFHSKLGLVQGLLGRLVIVARGVTRSTYQHSLLRLGSPWRELLPFRLRDQRLDPLAREGPEVTEALTQAVSRKELVAFYFELGIIV